jgi:hypothetical protein
MSPKATLKCPYCWPANSASMLATSRAVSAEKIVRRFEIPGFSAGSNRMSVPESVTAERIFLAARFGSSVRLTTPECYVAEPLIFAVGFCRS